MALFSMLTIYCLFPTFIINIILFFVPKNRKSINISFICGSMIGIVFGGFIGLGMTLGSSKPFDFLVFYMTGLVTALFILLPFTLAYFINRVKNILNDEYMFFCVFLLFFVEIFLTFLYLKNNC